MKSENNNQLLLVYRRWKSFCFLITMATQRSALSLADPVKYHIAQPGPLLPRGSPGQLQRQLQRLAHGAAMTGRWSRRKSADSQLKSQMSADLEPQMGTMELP
jgi:hypothetical protein